MTPTFLCFEHPLLSFLHTSDCKGIWRTQQLLHGRYGGKPVVHGESWLLLP